MFNPLVDDFSKLSNNEVEGKIIELSRKYFQTRNPDLQQQISVILEMYKEEMRSRNARSQLKQQEDGDNPLDNLINVS